MLSVRTGSQKQRRKIGEAGSLARRAASQCPRHRRVWLLRIFVATDLYVNQNKSNSERQECHTFYHMWNLYLNPSTHVYTFLKGV